MIQNNTQQGVVRGMKSSTRLVMGFLFILGIVLMLVIVVEETKGETIIVSMDGSGDYDNIQDAIDNATGGDTIRVWEGTYYENVVVDKTVSLAGNGSEETTIDGGREGNVVDIEADWVNMSGFSVTGSGGVFPDYNSGIKVISNHNRLFDNNCSNNYLCGIHLKNSNYNTLTNNTASDNGELGIYLWNSNDCTITNNTCSNNSIGIFLSSSSDCIIMNNKCSANDHYGISVDWDSSDCTIEKNICSSSDWAGIDASSSTIENNICSNNSGSGISAYSSTISNNICSNNSESGISADSSTISNNICSNNSGSGISADSSTISNNICSNNSDGGIYLRDTNDCTISNNICSFNGEYGILLRDSPHCTIENNTCSSNEKHGIYLWGSSDCTIGNNTMNENGIFIFGILENWISHDLDTTNTVNGKPVYYFKKETGFTVPTGAGQIILANCTWIRVENQNCSNGSVGILVGFSSYITITNCTYSNNYYGISFYQSSDSTITNNTCGNNNIGILLRESRDCTIENNICSNNNIGINLYYYSSSNTLANNICEKNNFGIFLNEATKYCTVSNNICSNNGGSGISFWRSSYCTITVNTCSKNGGSGIYLWGSSYSTINNNTCSKNGESGIIGGSYSTIENNTCSNNGGSGISGGSYSTFNHNTCSNNEESGISGGSYSIFNYNTCNSNKGSALHLPSSRDCILKNNTMNENGIFIFGSLESWNSHTVETTNTVNGKPVYYFKNVTGFTVPNGAGQVILANCSWINVENQNYSNGSIGILVGYSSNITLENNTCSNNQYGIYLRDTSYCTITNNTCSLNEENGIYIYSSSYCTITNNSISQNRVGIYLTSTSWENGAHYNNIFDNTESGIDKYFNTVNATYNWWGAASGPYHPTKNPEGEGDNVTDYVEFDPWLEEEVNWQPEAFINSISSNPAVEGETVIFNGSGTDDGFIERYAWRTEVKELYDGTNSSFTVSTLSAGTHYIYLKVQDNHGIWSEEVSLEITILKDTDGDSIPDIEDAFINDAAASTDIDDDGYPDEWNEGNTADDSTTDLKLDEFPDDPEKWKKDDSNGDGFLPGFEAVAAVGAIGVTIVLYRKKGKKGEALQLWQI